MSRERDATLAATLCFLSILLGWLAGAQARPTWLLGGAGATIATELLAYRRAAAVRSQFDRPAVTTVAAVGAAVTIGAGAVLAPDRSLSVAVGALGTYLLLLGAAAVVESPPGTGE